MVSVYPNPPAGQDFPNHLYGYYKGDEFLDWNMDDSNKKVRKPYTITKSRESWTEQEHDKFLEAIQLFDRDWKKIEAFVGSKTVIQIRSHAQKYFLKVQKNGTSEHVPPPRPKRKAAHPYPQKASKNVRQESVLVPGTAISGAVLSSWNDYVVPSGHGVSDGPKDDLESAGVTTTHNYSSSSNESTPRVPTYDKKNNIHGKGIRVVPDFAQVYRFIGSIFDPDATNHLQRLKQMDPINMETALMLMKNLSGNLVNPEFENHKKLLSSQNVGIKEHCTRRAITSG